MKILDEVKIKNEEKFKNVFNINIFMRFLLLILKHDMLGKIRKWNL